MQFPVDITFREMAPSLALEATIQRWVARLEHIHDRIVRCALMIEAPHKRGRESFHVNITLTLPGREITVSHASDVANHDDAYAAVADAFRAARRQLIEHNTRMQLHAAG